MYYYFNKLNHNTSEDKKIQQNETVEIKDGYRNIVIFGVDSRQNETKISTHSDTIIIVSINNKTKDVKLASIYRDTYVKIPDKNEFDKINAAYFRGGYSLALSTINKNLDLGIKEYVTVSFKAVVDAIDVLGEIKKQLDRLHFAASNDNIYNIESTAHIIKTLANEIEADEIKTAAFKIELAARRGSIPEAQEHVLSIDKIFEAYKKSIIQKEKCL
jgi:LCP family protein required for cell wall assembly